MKNITKVLIGLGGAVLGIGGMVSLQSQQENIIEPTEIVEVAEVCSESKMLYTVHIKDGKFNGSNANYCTLSFMEALDANETVEEITKDQFDKILIEWDYIDGEVIEGQNAINKENKKIEKESDKIHKQIGELEVLKLGGKTGQDAKINELKSQLR